VSFFECDAQVDFDGPYPLEGAKQVRLLYLVARSDLGVDQHDVARIFCLS
jgi:hypothetical protein